MDFSEIYLSAPFAELGETPVDNEEVLDTVKRKFSGKSEDWTRIEKGIRYVFRTAGSQTRYLGCNPQKNPRDYAVKAAQKCLDFYGLQANDVDLLIYGGIVRDYLEPATAMEVAAKLGIEKVQAFDVTTACTGLLQAVITAAVHMHADPSINYALCCSADFVERFINYSIQSFDELTLKAAGLTLGSAAGVWLLSRQPLGGGGGQILHFQNTALPKSYEVCTVPINGKFSSHSKTVFDLGLRHVPAEILRLLNALNWRTNDVDHFLSHQPGKRIIMQLCKKLNINPEKAPVTHSLYGNTATTSALLAMRYLLDKNKIKHNDRLVLSSAAAGFSMVSMAARWVNGGSI